MAIKQILLISLVLIAPSLLHAQTITAASCNASDVQTALNSVTSTTTTVTIPPGSCSWATQVTFTVPSGNTNLTIQGSTTCSGTTPTSCADNTQIIDNYASSNPLFLITTGVSGSSFRMTGMTFQGGSGLVKYNGIVLFQGNSQSFRLDHSHFNMATYSPSTNGYLTRFNGWIYGVMDHNVFQMTGTGQAVEEEMDGYGGYDHGNGAFADPTNLGTNKYLYIENNTFSQATGGTGYFGDCYAGGRMVVRFNNLNGVALQMHATGGQDFRGCRSAESYDNTYNPASSGVDYTSWYWDSATGMIWGNLSNQATTQFITLQSDRTSDSDHVETPCNSATDCSNAWGYCGTNLLGLGSTWDQNSSLLTGYRCLDEPGTGQSDLLVGQFPNKCDQTSGQCAIQNYKGTWANQALEPIYEWADGYQGISGYGCAGDLTTPFCITSSLAGGLAANQDFYQSTLRYNGSSFTGTTFNGTSGTGWGTFASRPSTCTTGVGYWATDQGNWNTTSTPSPVAAAGTQGQFYKCTSTNAWTLFYTPYTYPHPLVSGTSGSSAQTPPAPLSLTSSAQ